MASLAWDIGWGDENIVVGIFDDGGDPKGHPELRLSPSGMDWTGLQLCTANRRGKLPVGIRMELRAQVLWERLETIISEGLELHQA